jgi:activator of 2-hydroxyglutaryl-CoA dehydratase
MKLGIDIGSTTVKVVLMNEDNEILYKRYERHMSSVFEKAQELLENILSERGDEKVKVVIT